MCTILLAWRCHPDMPIILAANRDELIARASAPPGVLSTTPLVMGGRDLVAGGTWLGVTVGGTVCAVTNRHPVDGTPKAPDPTRRSRGEIPGALLTGVHAQDVPARLAVLGPGRYNPVNVVWVSADRALIAEVDDSGPVRVIDLQPGAHVLTTSDLDDSAIPKVAMLRAGMDSALAAGGAPGELLLRMRVLLASHSSPTGRAVDAACIHGDVYGTVSASSVLAGSRAVAYEHAPGRPCVTPFARVAFPG